MSRIFLAGILFWIVLFWLRIIQIGGIDPTFKQEESEMFLPAREYLTDKIDQILPYPQSALLSGILLGSQKNLPFTFKNELKITSTIHIVVVSGQNLTILAGFIMSLAALLGRRKTIILTLCVIVLYSLLTGLQIPVLRAAIMVTMAYLAQILGKEKTGWWVLVITGGVMLLYNPNWLLSISFQLSFLATFGVIVVAPILVEVFKMIPKILKEDLAVTLAAQLMVLPIIAYNFNQISAIGILVNSLILWTIPIVMVSGFASLIVGLINSFLGQVVGLVPAILLTYFIDLVKFFSKIPGANFFVGQTGPILWVGYYIILGAIIWGICYHLNYDKTKIGRELKESY
ncbi:MAG: ComEC/Rec2 family competence protein [Candidatus Daviesbacteria bacterium]